MANIELDGANKKIKVDSGDLTLDVPGDIILDADGADLVFADGGTNILKVSNSSSDVVFQPQVDAKDIIFKQYDGTTVATVEDNGTFNIPTDKLAINGTAVTSTAAELNILDGVTSTTAELNILDGVTATAAEINLIDGGTARGTTAIADGDGVLINDAGTMRMTSVETLKTYIGGFDVSSITGATALAATPATTDELVLSDAGTLKRMDFDHIFNTPAFIVGRTGGQLNVNNNTYTKLEFDNEILDTNSAFGSNKFTVPTGEGGKYHFIAGCGTAPPGSGARNGIAFYKNGSILEHGRMRDSAGGTANDTMLNAAVILSLSADDYIEVFVRHNKGSDLAYYDDNMYFAGYKLIGV